MSKISFQNLPSTHETIYLSAGDKIISTQPNGFTSGLFICSLLDTYSIENFVKEILSVVTDVSGIEVDTESVWADINRIKAEKEKNSMDIFDDIRPINVFYMKVFINIKPSWCIVDLSSKLSKIVRNLHTHDQHEWFSDVILFDEILPVNPHGQKNVRFPARMQYLKHPNMPITNTIQVSSDLDL